MADPQNKARGQRVAIPLDPDDALRALLKVDLESEPVKRDDVPPKHKQDADKPE
jgi:hypothetical protein